MRAAQESSETAAMLAAVRLNWQLWTIIQSELLAPECSVPMDIRQNVLALANFIDKHTVGFLGKPSPERMNVLISINRELAGGLFTTVGTASSASSSPAAADPQATSRLPTDTSA